MKTTLQRYIDNPGIIKGASVNSQIKLITADYERRFDTLLVREGGDFAYFLYKDTKKENMFYIHILVPSENTKNVYYDVIFEFYNATPEKVGFNLSNYDIRFFSNDPAFVFTYGFVFNQNKLLIDWLAPKISKTALMEKPVIRNPKKEVGYIKSFYFAYFYMKTRKLFYKAQWTMAKPLNKANILKAVTHSDNKLSDISTAKEVEKQLKIQQQQQDKKKSYDRDVQMYASDNVKFSKTSPITKRVLKARYTSSIKTSKRIGKK